MRNLDFTPTLSPSNSAFPANKATPALKEERLPFTVRLATTEEDILKAVQVRHSAYGRHLPELAKKLELPEEADSAPGVAILLAESKLDGSPLGTMRIQTNQYKSLGLEQSVELPNWLKGTNMAEATRLGVGLGRMGTMVKTVLFKAFFQYCQQNDIDWMVICARTPLDVQYEHLLFKDVYENEKFVPLRHTGNIMHRVLAFDVKTAEIRWAAANHPLLNFMCGTLHNDIKIEASKGISDFYIGGNFYIDSPYITSSAIH